MFAKLHVVLSILSVVWEPFVSQGGYVDPSCVLDNLADFLQCSQEIQRCQETCPDVSIPGLGGTFKDGCGQISTIPGISNVDVVYECCVEVLATDRVVDFNKGVNCETLLKIQNCATQLLPVGSVFCPG